MGSKVAIVGTGYVGLTTGACFAHIGHDVTCADVDPQKVERLSRGELPIFEPRLQEIVTGAMRAGRLRFVLGAREAVRECEFAYLCVPTPQGDDGSADLRYIEAAAAEISPVLPSEAVVVNKSTVPVGSTKIVEQVLQRPDVKVVSNPEFLREGSAVHDFLHPDRIVIGSDDQATAIRVAALYLGITAPLIVTDPASAETIKYAANAFWPRRSPSSTPSRRCARPRGRHQRRRPGHRVRQAHRPRVPPTGTGMGRELPPEGHPGSRPHGGGGRLPLRPVERRHQRQRRAA